MLNLHLHLDDKADDDDSDNCSSAGQHQPLPRPAGAPGEGGVTGPGLQVIKLVSQETLQHLRRLHLHEIRHKFEGGALLTMK